ncbi:flavodoxin FldA [Fischerella sp. PCC 9605]|uniref:flavodoxin FldA n=1 Tax=Fischerella sp. PCC 9605 TaxID=1173024 RepID=UPI0009E65E0C|nr:flavodoxin FldA [Fischerella sp. PCC 9605]
MAKIGLFFGTQTGNTQTEAEMIQKEFGGESVVDLNDISKSEPSDFNEYSYIIIGCPTWNIGELQSDWEDFYDELDNINFSGKKVAYFGAGDQVGYPDTFQDAIGILEEKISEQGGETIGYWSTEGYEFNESKAIRDGKFVGLALDEDNQSDLTEERIKTWVAQLKQEFDVNDSINSPVIARETHAEERLQTDLNEDL